MSAAAGVAVLQPTTSIATNTAPVQEQRRSESSAFLVAERVIRANAKDVLKTIKTSFEWIQHSKEHLKDSIPIGNLINFTKIGEDSFVFQDFARSILKIGHNIRSFITIGFSQNIRSFVENSLDLVWNTYKFFKALKNPIFPIFSLSSKILIPLKGIGGSCFALSAANRIYKNVKKGNDFINHINTNPPTDPKEIAKNEAHIFAGIFEIAKNICIIAIGIIATYEALSGILASGLVYLVLGTPLLISNITASSLLASHDIRELFEIRN